MRHYARIRPRRIKIDRACRIYWKLHGSKRPSWKNYRLYLSNIQEFFEGKYIDDITYMDVEDYRRWREKSVSPTTVNKEHTVITHIYNQLRRWMDMGKIKPVTLPKNNPGTGVKKAPLRSRTRTLTSEEIDLLLGAATPQLRRIFIMALNTALRKKDLRLLRKSQNVNKTNNCLEGIQAKTGKPYSIPINKAIQEIIDTAPNDKILSFMNYMKEYAACRERAGLPDVQLRDFRRTAATRLLRDGKIDIAVVSDFLGHTSLEMTQIYVQPENKDKRKASQFLGRITSP